jgi:type I restriction enzyme R subunit
MASSKVTYDQDTETLSSVVKEEHIETGFVEKLRSLKYTIRPDIRDRAALEQNFREKFEALNRVNLTDGEFQRLLDQIITPDVFTALKTHKKGLMQQLFPAPTEQAHTSEGQGPRLFPSPEEVA